MHVLLISVSFTTNENITAEVRSHIIPVLYFQHSATVAYIAYLVRYYIFNLLIFLGPAFSDRVLVDSKVA